MQHDRKSRPPLACLATFNNQQLQCPNTVRFHRVLRHRPNVLSPLPRCRRQGQVAAAPRLHRQGSRLGCRRRRAATACRSPTSRRGTATASAAPMRTRAERTHPLQRSLRRSQPARRNDGHHHLEESVSVGTEMNIVQEASRTPSPCQQCYLGWQQSLGIAGQAGGSRGRQGLDVASHTLRTHSTQPAMRRVGIQPRVPEHRHGDLRRRRPAAGSCACPRAGCRCAARERWRSGRSRAPAPARSRSRRRP